MKNGDKSYKGNRNVHKNVQILYEANHNTIKDVNKT